MKHKGRFLSLLLALALIAGLLPVSVFAEAEQPAADAVVYVSLSRNGTFLTSGEKTLAYQSVTVKDRNADGKLDMDETLYAAHEAFYTGGAAAGYATESGQYGLSLTKLWGDTSYNFGYYLNGAMTMGLADEVKAGDHAEAFIYESAYPDTEGYAKFAQPTASVKVGSALNLTLTYVSGYDDMTWAPVFAPLAGATVTVDGVASGAFTDADGKAALTLTEAGTHILSAVKTKTVGTDVVTAVSAPVCVVTVTMPDARITVPADAALFVGTKGQVSGKDTHFVAFNEIAPKASAENAADGTKTYYFDLTDNKTYNYRVSGENYVTTAGTFKKTADFTLTVDKTLLQPAGITKTTVDHDVSSNGGYNMADVYLNVNAAGYLKLDAVGDSHQLVAIRNWQTIDSTTNNYFIEPDYHYTVLSMDGSAGSGVVTVSENGLISAVGEGTAIVLVTYDAIYVSPAVGGPFFGAIWPENTGVFVVSVGAGDSGIETGMTINEGKNTNAATQKMALDAIDAELDVIYFTGSKGSYTFTPVTADCAVSVANPTVDTAMHFTGFTSVTKNVDNSFTVPLTEGRNIVKLEKGGKAEYQVITAKRVSYTVNKGIPVIPGDTVSIVFDTLYHPANKLSGVYNMSTLAIYNDVDAFAGKLIGTAGGQYNFASNAASQTVSGGVKKNSTAFSVSYVADKSVVLQVPADWAQGSFCLKDGCFVAVGFGDPYGNHRGITATSGKAPNLDASVKEGILGSLPDITVPVTHLEGLTVTKQPDRTAYSIGDSFDPTGMVVKAVYTGGVQVEVENYSFPTDAFDAAGAKQVTITYKQADTTVTATVNITVDEAELTHIAVTAQPAKTAYQVNENFDDTGMVVTAYYSNSSTKTITQYTLSHGKLISTDKAVTVTYNGKTDEVPVSVTGRVLSKITVTTKPTKMTYEVGEYLDPTGMVITATYNDTTTADVTGLVTYASAAFTAAGTNKTNKISYTENGTTKTVNLTGIKVVAATVPETPPETITVSFALLGDSAHDSDTDGVVHTLLAGNLESWIEATDITVNADATVMDVVAKALSSHGIPYSNPTGNYISSIRGLAEFTNGVNSGWMYTLNGKHASLGVGEQTLKDGDVIVLHYTDDYTEEQEKGNWGESVKKDKTPQFDDVEKDAYYADAVAWAVQNKITEGVDDTHFAPNADCTRAQTVTFLWRAAGCPEPKNTANPFTDVNENAYYYKAVLWAAEKGITTGVTTTEFDPEGTVSRAQVVTFLFRFAEGVGGGDSAFTDVEADAYYAAAVSWAAEKGITKGSSETTFSPEAGCLRGQIVTFLYRHFA